MDSCKMTCITFLTLAIFLYAVNSLQRRLPLGFKNVKQCNEFDAIYVDKTKFAMELIQSGTGPFLLLRPRRFGKTFFVNTLASILRGERDVFAKYYIGDSNNGYPWTVHQVLELTFRIWDPIDHLARTLAGIARHNGVDRELAHIPTASPIYFEELLRRISPIDKHGTLKPGKIPPLALLIDEYDLPFQNRDNTTQDYFTKIFGILKNFTDKNIVRFVFITGCNKVDLLGTGLSTTLAIEDISLQSQYSAVCGFTEGEIKINFDDFIKDIANWHRVESNVIYEQIEYMYEGYKFTPDSPFLYNPISLLFYLRNKYILKPENYWIQTQKHPKTVMEALIEARLRSKKVIFNLKKQYTTKELFQPIGNITNLHQVAGPEIDLKDIYFESILFQNGYLTIKEYNVETDLYTLQIPNKEVMDAFMEGIKLAMEKESEFMNLHREAKSSLQNLNIIKFVQTFSTYLERHKHLVETITKDKEGFMKGLLEYLLNMDPASRSTPEWNVVREAWTKKSSGTPSGQIDFLIETSKYRIIIEGKYEAKYNELEEGWEQAKNYKFPRSESKDNRTLVKLVFNFNEEGISDWTGDVYDADNNFVRKLDEDRIIFKEREFKCDFLNCNKSWDSKRSLANHKRVHEKLAKEKSVE